MCEIKKLGERLPGGNNMRLKYLTFSGKYQTVGLFTVEYFFVQRSRNPNVAIFSTVFASNNHHTNFIDRSCFLTDLQ